MTYEMPMFELSALASDLVEGMVSHLTDALIEGNDTGERIDPAIFTRDCERIVHGILRQHGFIITRSAE